MCSQIEKDLIGMGEKQWAEQAKAPDEEPLLLVSLQLGRCRSCGLQPSCNVRFVALFGLLAGAVLARQWFSRAKIFDPDAQGSDFVNLAAAPGSSAVPAKEKLNYGIVDSIFTFGAPGTASPALPNLLSEDQCFRGLRTFNEDVLGPITKEEDAAAISNQFEHARAPSLRLHWAQDSKYVSCPGEVMQPFSKGDKFANWGLHWEDKYTPRIKHVSVNGTSVSNVEPFSSAYGIVRIAYKQYDTTANAKRDIQLRLGEQWKIVARETLIQGAGGMYDEDPLMIVQDWDTLDCVIAFAGVNNYGNELGTATNLLPTSYCGFTHVHMGYRDELRRMVLALMPRLKPKLAKCQRVTCTGHSMGGSLCDIFSACANSLRYNNSDFMAQAWLKVQAERMPEIEEGGVVMAPGAEKICSRPPPCPK